MPPRHGKSELISRWFPLWVLETYPDWRVILSSYEASYAASWGRKVRDAISNNGDQLLVRISGNSSAADYWETTKGGGMMTAGAGGALTGKGANVLIVDDPLKNWAEANSPVVRERIWDWWQSTAYTRLEPDGIAIIVQTRWHEEDLAGRLLRGGSEGRENWDLLNLPAIAEPGDMLGRQIGEPLWPERFDSESLQRIQGTLDTHVWLPLYQQRPLGASGIGKVYHAWSEENCRELEHDPMTPISWALDFNVDPMCSVIAQIRDQTSRMDMLSGRRAIVIQVLDEICLPNSHTEEACRVFMERAGQWFHSTPLTIQIYGDSSGNNRKTSNKTDWQIVREVFAADRRFRLEFHIRPANPAVKDRTNAVNAALFNSAGQRRLFYDPRCKELQKDFCQVKWKRDMSGNATNEIDKSSPLRTHVSDALGYLIESEMGLKQQGGARPERLL